MKSTYFVIAERGAVDGAHVVDVEAEDYAEAIELAVPHLKRWRDKARAENRPFILRGGVRILIKSSGTMPAVKP